MDSVPCVCRRAGEPTDIDLNKYITKLKVLLKSESEHENGQPTNQGGPEIDYRCRRKFLQQIHGGRECGHCESIRIRQRIEELSMDKSG